MKKIFNHSIIGSANRGKEDILFESIEEIQTHYSGVEWEGVDFLKCELFTPKEDKIIGYVLSYANVQNSLLFIAVYEFEKDSFIYKVQSQTPRFKLFQYLHSKGFKLETCEKSLEMCEKTKIGYNVAYFFASIIEKQPYSKEKSIEYINKYFEIMKT